MTKIRIIALSKLLVCSTRWVRDLVEKGILPAPVQGLFALEECIPKYVNFLRAATSSAEYQRLKNDHLGQRIVKLRLETKLIEQEVVPKDYAEKILSQSGARFDLAYQQLPISLSIILTNVRRDLSLESDENYQRFLAALLKRSFQDMTREIFFGIPRGTPTVMSWEWELVKFGVIEPDQSGNVLHVGTHGKRLMKAADVVARGELAVQRMENKP